MRFWMVYLAWKGRHAIGGILADAAIVLLMAFFIANFMM